ncbi:hypothetical protein ACT2GS_14425, partial [Paraburkholderia fungorum]
PELPINIVRRADLRQWLRDKRAQHAASMAVTVDVAAAWAAIQRISSTDERDLKEHREKVRANPRKAVFQP